MIDEEEPLMIILIGKLKVSIYNSTLVYTSTAAPLA
jgi:hypothetical protein